MAKQIKGMFAEVRRQEIASVIVAKNVVMVDELCELFDVSAATIRNDLTELERQGVLQRTHGGAIYKQGNSLQYEQTSIEKEVQNLEQKQAIAREALNYIRPGSVIGLDTGTTTLELAKLLLDIPDLTVITNDLKIASVLEAADEINILLLGGFVRRHFHCTIGKSVSDALKNLHMDTLFLATNGMSAQRGFNTPNMDTADIKRDMISSATRVVVLAESAKANRETMVTFASLEDVDMLISNSDLEDDFLDAAIASGIHVVKAED